MLPWRRSKFVLVEDEAKAKPKSLGAGPTYHSILSALLRSCPDLLPDCPLHWLGSVFQTKRQKVELNREEPTYNVRYLGSVVTILAKGDGCTQEAVAKIWTRSDYGEQSARMRLSVEPHGIRMSADKHGKTKNPTHLYTLNRITYCAADPSRPKILAWVYRHQAKNKAVVLRCHAALVSRSEKARAIARSFLQTSAAAFGEFKRLKRQSDVRRCRQQRLGEGAVPAAPRRRLLNGQCRYRPPAGADNPGAPPHLCSIAEEEEEEERGEKEERGEEEEVGKEDRCEESEKRREDREEKGEEAEDRNRETFTDSVPLYKVDLGELISGLTECQINIISDGNNNTMTFISTLV